VANKQLKKNCGLLPYTCGLMSSWVFVLWASVLWFFVLGAFVLLYTPCSKKTKPLNFGSNFVKFKPILKIFSLTDSAGNLLYSAV